jgi:4-amino-4-deoxy-L-arabinose transferase-like glycosyltransferase
VNARPTDLGLADIAGRVVPVDAVDTAPIPVVRVPVAVPAQVMPGPGAGRRAMAAIVSGIPLAAVLAVAAFLRFWQLAAVGFNGDEAVYTGTAASIAGDHSLSPMFPVFRAHPLLFQTLLSLVLRIHETDWTARAFPAAIGVATVAVTYLLASRLYGRKAGLIAGLLLAVMPYHVVVSRQVLLDGLMTLMATGALYCVVRYLETVALRWLLAAGSVMGLAILSKETSVILLGGLYVFFALTPSARMRGRHILLALLVVVAEAAVWIVALRLSGQSHKGQSYLLWQMFRPANHGTWFYFTVLPSWIGWAVLATALAGLVWLRREATWRERLLLAWLIVPVLFFTIWPVKGFQYLLPVAPPLAVLAGRTLSRPLVLALPGRLTRPAGLTRPAWFTRRAWFTRPAWLTRRAWLARPTWLTGLRPSVPGAAMTALAVISVVSLAVPAWNRAEPSTTRSFLAGTGGLSGAKQAGEWVLRNVPAGGRLLAIGPSLANVLEFYGRHSVSALSVSSNPRNRNPSYTPVPNPDRAVRTGNFQYIVWDSYTAARTPFFAREAHRLASRYHGVTVFTATATVRSSSGHAVVEPVVVIYEVHP